MLVWRRFFWPRWKKCLFRHFVEEVAEVVCQHKEAVTPRLSGHRKYGAHALSEFCCELVNGVKRLQTLPNEQVGLETLERSREVEKTEATVKTGTRNRNRRYLVHCKPTSRSTRQERWLWRLATRRRHVRGFSLRALYLQFCAETQPPFALHG